MEHHVNGSTALLLANLWVMVAACDVATEAEPATAVEAHSAANVVVESEATLEAKAGAQGAAGVEVTIEPARFDLEAVTELVSKGEVESAAELEVIVNDEARGYNRIDIDADGRIDHVRVVEVRGPDTEADVDVDVEAELAADAALELRVVPSSGTVEAEVVFATVAFARHPVNSEVEVRGGFTAVVRQPEVRVYTHVVPVKIEAGILVGGSVFLSWLYAVERPVYVGVYEVDARGQWIPPGHVKHGHWKATGSSSVRAEGRGREKADGKLVVVDVRGSSKGHGKIQLGGSGKGSAKVHASAGGHGGGSSKSGKSKSGKSNGGKGGKGKGK